MISMSSSTKKKLRQEQVSAQKAKQQKTAKKESDKMKLYTGIFFVVLALMLVVVVIALIDNSGIVERNTTAVKVGEEPVSAAEMNMYYIETINEFYNANANYLAMYGLDPYTALDQQRSSDGTTTWADYFIDLAKEDIRNNYAIYNSAVEAGYQLSESDQAKIDEMMADLDETAASGGYSSTNKYLESIYGTGANTETYKHVMEVMSVASAYYADYQDSLSYSADLLASTEAKNPLNYNHYSYDTFIMYASTYLEGGTETEDGKIEYSDAENAAALAAAEADAKVLVENTYASSEEFNNAINALPIHADGKNAPSVLSVDNKGGHEVIELVREWVTDPARQPGDVTYVERITGTGDEATVGGYNVIYFRGATENKFPLINVRHILTSFEGGTVDQTTGETKYSTVEIAKAKDAAQAIYDEWLAGEATEESFAALANEYSTDPGSNTIGGLYENVYPNEMVAEFNDWCYDESRQPGDHAIIETDYGYHIMYFSGYSETNYRDYLITQELIAEDMAEWNATITEQNPITDVNLSRVNKDLILYNMYYNY